MAAGHENNHSANHLALLTSSDMTHLLAQFTIDHTKSCDHCLYICMRRLTDCACNAIFNIAQAHSIPLINIIGKVIHHQPNQHINVYSQHPLRQFHPQPQPQVQHPPQVQHHFLPQQFQPPPQIFHQPIHPQFQLVRLPFFMPQQFLQHPEPHFLQQQQQLLQPPHPSQQLLNLDKLQIASEDVDADNRNV
jgi:hypothetical protein